jgi:hypothetical protein
VIDVTGIAWTLYQMDESKRLLERIERQAYDVRMMRGPMIAADIDWREPLPGRPMVAEDIGICEHDWQISFGSTPFGGRAFCAKCGKPQRFE